MEDVYIHPSAFVSKDCCIGKGTKIWVNAQVRENSTIGENCIISKDTYIDIGVEIGNNVKIQNGVSVFHGVTIADDVLVGPNVCFTNDYYPRSFNNEWIITETKVRHGASIGANATIICGNTLGEYCMVGAGSVVTKDVPPYTLVVGNPAVPVGKVCKCGRRLQNDKCLACEV